MKTSLLSLAVILASLSFAQAKDEDIAVTELPKAVTESIAKQHPQATLISAERDLKAGGEVQHYEVKVRDGETMKELTVLADGTIQKTEKED
jgi:hypothetical protein